MEWFWAKYSVYLLLAGLFSAAWPAGAWGQTQSPVVIEGYSAAASSQAMLFCPVTSTINRVGCWSPATTDAIPTITLTLAEFRRTPYVYFNWTHPVTVVITSYRDSIPLEQKVVGPTFWQYGYWNCGTLQSAAHADRLIINAYSWYFSRTLSKASGAMLRQMLLAGPPRANTFTNPENQFDVNADGTVNAADYELLAAKLNSGETDLSGIRGLNQPFFDVIADGGLTPLDLVSLINHMNAL